MFAASGALEGTKRVARTKAFRKRDSRKLAIGLIVQRLHSLLAWSDSFAKRSSRMSGLLGSQLWILRTIALAGSLNVMGLCDRVHLQARTVRKILRELEKRDLIDCNPTNLSNPLVCFFSVRPKGYEIIGRLSEPPRSLLAKRVEAMSAAELSRMKSALDLLAKIARGH